jgi:hypothetical protein
VLNASQPAQAHFQPTIGSRLKGVLLGLATGGIPGAVVGGVSPTTEQQIFTNRQQLAAAKVKFADAQAAYMVGQATAKQKELGDYDADHQRAVFKDNLATANELMQMGYAPNYTTGDDGPSEMAALQDVTAKQGAVPPSVSLAVAPNAIMHFDLSAANGQHAQYEFYAQLQKDLGKPVPNEQMFMSQNQQQRYATVADAMHYWNPPASPQSLAILQSDRETLAHLPDNVAPSNRDATLAHLDQTISNIQGAITKNKVAEGQAEGAGQAAKIAAETPATVAQEVAKRKATLPFDLAKTKAEEAIKDGDPNAAAQLLVNGDVAPSQIISSRKPAFAQQAFSAAKQLDPNWNSQTAEAYYKTASSPTNVTFFGSAKSLTDQGGTLDQLQQAYNKLPNGRIPALNKFSDWAAAASGSGATAAFAQTAIGVADDYSKVMGGGQGSDTSRDQVLESFARSGSGAQMAGAIGAARQAVDSQMSSRIGQNPVMRRMYGSGLLIHVTDPKGTDQVFRTQQQADAYRKAIGQ